MAGSFDRHPSPASRQRTTITHHHPPTIAADGHLQERGCPKGRPLFVYKARPRWERRFRGCGFVIFWQSLDSLLYVRDLDDRAGVSEFERWIIVEYVGSAFEKGFGGFAVDRAGEEIALAFDAA